MESPIGRNRLWLLKDRIYKAVQARQLVMVSILEMKQKGLVIHFVGRHDSFDVRLKRPVAHYPPFQ
jgi:hypothetical protein